MSDSDNSIDSDSGIRFKTQSVRNLFKDNITTFDRHERNDSHKYNKRLYTNYDDHRKRYKDSHRTYRRETSSSKSNTEIRKSNNLDLNTAPEHKIPENRYSTISSINSTKTSKNSFKSGDGNVINKYGPSLPPSKVVRSNIIKKDASENNKESENKFAPSSKLNISERSTVTHGPTLPSSCIEDSIKHTAENVEQNNKSILGPCLPSKLKKSETDTINVTYGPTLPSTSIEDSINHTSKNVQKIIKTKSTFGPCLPSKLNKPEESTVNVTYGPTLPIKNVKLSEDIMGPQLPSKSEPTYGSSISSTNTSTAGDSITNSISNTDESISDNHNESDDEDIIGPLPPGVSTNSRVQSELEYRALELKMKLEFPTIEKKDREEWMIELPAIQKVSGLGPRTFRANPAPDLSDRSFWTDTPLNKSEKRTLKSMKNDLKTAVESFEVQKRDEEQEKIIKNHKKHSKRDKSLVDIHQQKLLKMKKEAGKTERRPFDRDIDLKLNMFDPSKKAKMLKNASLLDDKFSTGKSKYL